MNEQQQHLTQLIQQQNDIAAEMQKLNNAFNAKKETLIKVQGAIEYLQQIGVTLSESEQEVLVETSEEVSE
jgi:plasmid maintenance system antidote protein VapI